ncbi:hypothetical protein OPU71_08270 [Niveibacterium sp. 24ML]|uniref:hypothetical protein n=1 Tax=Niveibacterium sp. 24ML TaxID=2985512 RepID=UPI002270021D|nr:hypothetical protein [Niveibacterium sp. 24ML]MCX9156116.1 hypothetical protein [Niveibacterium sp. 24ML]
MTASNTMGNLRQRFTASISLPRFKRAMPAGIKHDTPGIEAWISTLPLDRPLACCETIVSRLRGALGPIIAPADRVDALDQIFEHVSPMLARLEAIPDGRGGNNGDMRGTIAVADRALERLAMTYAEIAINEARSRPERRFQVPKFCRRAALRACQLAHRRVLLTCRSYGELNGGHWRVLAELFMAASVRGFENTSLEVDSGDTIARYFARTLLLVLADPHRLSRRNLEHVRFYIERYGHHARIRTRDEWTGDAEGWFPAWPAHGDIRRPLRREELMRGEADLLLDVHPLLAKLDTHCEGLAAGTSPTRLGLPLIAREGDYPELLKQLRDRWGSPPQRKHIRRKAHPSAALVCGFDQVRQLMKRIAGKRQTDAAEAMPAFPSTEWSIMDRSEGGLRLNQEAEDPLAVEVGELIALSQREDGEVHLAVARRAMHQNSHETEIGVQLISGPGIAARFKPPTRDAKGRERDSIPIIFLPRVHGLDTHALLAPLDQVEPGLIVALPHRNGVVRFEATGRIERLAGCELIGLKPCPSGNTQ